MSKVCKSCNKKMGLFEKKYNDGLCEECFKKKEEKKYFESESEILKRRIEEEKTLDEQKKRYLEEKKEFFKRKEEEKKAIEEQKKLEELPKITHKLELDKHVKNMFSLYLVNYMKSSFLFDYPLVEEVFSEEYDSTAKVVSEIIYKMYDYLPINFDINDLKELEILKNIIMISDEMSYLFKYKIDGYSVKILEKIFIELHQYAMQKKYNILNLNKSVFGWYSSYISLEPEMTLDFINAIAKEYENMININNETYEKILSTLVDYSEILKEGKIEERFYLFEIYYSIALNILYMAYYSNEIKIFFSNNDVATIYNNMKNEFCTDEEISEKLFMIYDNLYRDNFEFELIRADIDCFVKVRGEEEKSNVLNNFNDNLNINSKEDLFDINEKDFYDKDCNEELKKEIYDNYIKRIYNYRENFNFTEILNNIGEIPNYVEKTYKKLNKRKAEIERDRLLNGEMYKEKAKAKNELDFSNITNGYDFEKYVSNLLIRLGNSIDKVTQKSGDQGADIVAHINDKKYVIQVKFYSNPVGNKAVQEVVASMGMYKADKAMVITNSTYTKSAIELARANDVRLIDGNQLNAMIKKVENNISNE